MKYLERLLLCGFMLAGAMGYCAAKREQDNFEYNKASLNNLAKKFDKIDLTKSDLNELKESLKNLLRNEAERQAEPKGEIKFIPKTGPENVVADLARAHNIVDMDEKTKETNIGLSKKDSDLLKTRLERISSDVTALTKSASWEEIAKKLEKINTYAPFSVPSQTTPKAMFSGVNAISKAATTFFQKMEERAKKELEIVETRAYVETIAAGLVTLAKDEQLLSNTTSVVKSIDQLIVLLKKIQTKQKIKDVPEIQGLDALSSILSSNEKSLTGLVHEVLTTMSKDGLKPKSGQKLAIIADSDWTKIDVGWHKFVQGLEARMGLETLARNIKEKFDKFVRQRKIGEFLAALRGLDNVEYINLEKLFKQLKASQLKDIADKLKHIGKTYTVSKELPWKTQALNLRIVIAPIKQVEKISSPKTAIALAINRVVDTFNESMKSLVKQMEGWK